MTGSSHTPAPTRVEVHAPAADGTLTHAGTAHFSTRRGITTTTFNYSDGWLGARHPWSISPDLRVHDQSASVAGLPGAFSDSAPDRWGRNLIRKHREAAARTSGSVPTLTEVDYLIGVSDLTRQGALRFAADDGTWLGERADVPKLIALPELLGAARAVDGGDSDDHEATKTLLDAGSGSLGGARPKASVSNHGSLLMAKFPHRGDDWSVTGWEMVALDLAELCGATTPPHRVIAVGDAHVLVVTRFDRLGSIRIPYVSAMTLLDRTDGANADYLEIAEALTDHSPHATADLHELWTRIAVSVAINNTDDHLRNHGFVRHDGGWALSPVFDLNPNPDSGADRVTPLGGASDRASSIEALVELSDWFDLDADSARRRWAHVAATVASAWRDLATNVGIRDVELARFATTFQR